MREIILPICKHDESSSTLEELGIPYSYANTLTAPMVFYNIASVAEFVENDDRLTEVHANGQIFVCSLPIEQVRDIIRKAYE